MTPYAVTALALAALLAAGAVHCIRCFRRAARELRAIQCDSDKRSVEGAAAQAVDRGLDRLFNALGPPPGDPAPEPTPTDTTPLGDDDWTRQMDRRMRRTARRRNTQPRKEEL